MLRGMWKPYRYKNMHWLRTESIYIRHSSCEECEVLMENSTEKKDIFYINVPTNIKLYTLLQSLINMDRSI